MQLNNAANPMAVVLGALLATVGAALFFACFWMVGTNAYVLLTYEYAPGVVVSSQRIGPPSARGSIFNLNVRYNSQRGWVTASPDRSFYSFDAGEAVSVYYRADEPFRIVVNSFRTIWFAPTVAGVVGLILIVQGQRLLFGRPAVEPVRPHPPR